MPITGTETNNTLYGTMGDDTIAALGGNDFIYGSNGNDVIDGGAGDDFLYFRFSNADLLTMPTAAVTYVLSNDFLTGSDGVINTQFTGIENVGFSMDPATAVDVTFDLSDFVATPSDSFLTYVLTGAGNDTLIGSAGDDYLNGRGGQNFIDGGDGHDDVWTYYADTSDVVTITGDAHSLTVTQGGVTLLTALNAERIGVNALSSVGNHIVDASGLVGVSATLVNTLGADTLIGSRQDDIFGADNDGAGADVLIGGGGADLFDYSFYSASLDATTIVDFQSDDFIDLLDLTVSDSGSYRLRDPMPISDVHMGSLSGAINEIAYHWADGQTIIEYDTDGDGLANQTMVLASGQFTLDAPVEALPDNSWSYVGGLRITQLGFDLGLSSGDDSFWGSASDDIIYGLVGNDLLAGLAGDDYINGGAGNDTANYHAAQGAVTVSLALQGSAQNTGGDGNDTLVGMENLIGSFYNDRLTGSTAANVIDGGDGNDQIAGGGGADWLFGAAGADTVRGGAHNDVIYGGAGDDRVYGDAGVDTLYAEDGNDTLDGGLGADAMFGGLGDDLYLVDDAGDSVSETNGAGIDTVRARGTSFTLGANVEKLVIATGNFDGTGNALDNAITGSSGNNVLSGLNGADTLRGNAGTDTLDGGAGADRLFGGTGKDMLTGGLGADVFAFVALLDSAAGATNADLIADFNHAQGDRIDLAAIDAIAAPGGANNAFQFVGTAAFSNTAGELRYRFDGAGHTLVQMDVDGDGVADMGILLNGEIALVAGDFVL